MFLPRRGATAQLECLFGIIWSHLQDDYAERAFREILCVVEKFCIPLGNVKDKPLHRKRCTATKGIVPDRELSETVHFLQFQAMPIQFYAIRRTSSAPLARSLCIEQDVLKDSTNDCSGTGLPCRRIGTIKR